MESKKKIKQMNDYNKTVADSQITENKLVVPGGEREREEGQQRGRGLRGTNYYV